MVSPLIGVLISGGYIRISAGTRFISFFTRINSRSYRFKDIHYFSLNNAAYPRRFTRKMELGNDGEISTHPH